MDEIKELFRELIGEVKELNSKVAELSSDITRKLDEVSSSITGPTGYNLEDLYKVLSSRD
jgi:hypothetical protein